MDISPQAQQLLGQAQSYQQQMQNILTQKEALNLQQVEIKRALEELEKVKDGDEVYKIAGPIIIKGSKQELLKELKEKEESATLRIKTLENSEKKIKEKLEELRSKLSKLSE